MYVHANAKLGLAGRFALVGAIEGGLSLRAAAAAFSVSPATAHRWWRRWWNEGGSCARSIGNWGSSIFCGDGRWSRWPSGMGCRGDKCRGRWMRSGGGFGPSPEAREGGGILDFGSSIFNFGFWIGEEL